MGGIISLLLTLPYMKISLCHVFITYSYNSVYLAGALTYAELGTSVPLSGGEHAYYMFTYKNMGRNFGQLPAFLYAWVGIFIIRPVMFSVISLSLGTYIVKPFFPGCEPPIMPIKLITAAAMCKLD